MAINKRQFEIHIFEPESSFEILIRGHLWIESLINQILAVHMTDSSILDIDRLGFRQKVDIAQAFGFIYPEDGRALRELNRLRNKLAHDLSAEPRESDIQNLLNVSEHPRGPDPVQNGQKGHPQHLGPAVITSHPGIVAQATRTCQAPGLPLPGRCRPAGPGRRRRSGPAASALAPRRSSAQPRDLPAGPRGPCHRLPPCGTTHTGDSSSNAGDPIHYESNLVTVVRRLRTDLSRRPR
jgi:hypothetical protein